MSITYVVRSYMGEVRSFGPIEIKPYFFTEVTRSVMDSLDDQAQLNLRLAKERSEVSVTMIQDGLPVAAQNESKVLRMADV